MDTLGQTIAVAVEEALRIAPPSAAPGVEALTKTLSAATGCSIKAILAEMTEEGLALLYCRQVLQAMAFEELMVHRYEKTLLQWFSRRCRDQVGAEDLVQGLYLKLLHPNTLARYDSRELFKPWLLKVMYNYWVSELRRQKPTMALTDTAGNSAGMDPTEQAIAHELQQRVEQVLQTLTEEERRVVEETIAGKSADEIAQLLHLPKSVVYRLRFQGRRAVGEALKTDIGSFSDR